VAVLVFLFVHMLPGDPARLIAGPEADAQVIDWCASSLGSTSRCICSLHYIGNVLQGDFGISMASRRPVGGDRQPLYAHVLVDDCQHELGGAVWPGGGDCRRVWRNRWPDKLGMALAVTGISFPAFALGMLLMQVFSVELGWLPTVGADSWRHYILPSMTLGRPWRR
jgi:glutathione transport system permease protein